MPLVIRQVVEDICQHLGQAGLPAADLTSVQIVIAEILNNIVEHAYGINGTGRFSVHIRVRGGLLFAGFCDCGQRIPTNVLTPQSMDDPDSDIPDLPEGGFGWSLIHILVSQLRYRYVSEQNWLTVAIPISIGSSLP